MDVVLAIACGIAGLIVPAKVGRQRPNRVPAVSQMMCRIPPDQLIASEVMRRIHVPDGEDAHAARIAGALTVLAAASLVLLLPGCGFNDQLTRRGFIRSGDLICAQTFIRTQVASREAAEQGHRPPATQVIGSLATGYGQAASRLRNLDVSGDDAAMRDRMVGEFNRLSQELGAAARSPGGDAGAALASVQAFTRAGPAIHSIQAYGFDLCGGRAQQA
jgi:hypothetical protein